MLVDVSTKTRRIDSPIGSLFLVSNGAALIGLYTREHPKWDTIPKPSNTGDRLLDEASRQLDEYFSGKRHSFGVSVAPTGSPFEMSVWRELRNIPFGKRRCYADIARSLGKPTAARAVGSANAKNPISIVIPCHRVVRSDGDLSGYAGGVLVKEWLLAHEGRRTWNGPART